MEITPLHRPHPFENGSACMVERGRGVPAMSVMVSGHSDAWGRQEMDKEEVLFRSTSDTSSLACGLITTEAALALLAAMCSSASQ